MCVQKNTFVKNTGFFPYFGIKGSATFASICKTKLK